MAFGKLARDFADRDAVVYGVSIDSEFVHLNWRLHHDDLRDLPIPMLADVKRELAASCGVLDRYCARSRAAVTRPVVARATAGCAAARDVTGSNIRESSGEGGIRTPGPTRGHTISSRAVSTGLTHLSARGRIPAAASWRHRRTPRR